MAEVLTFPLGPLETNSYLVLNGERALAVDVGGDPAPLLAELKKRGATLSAILLTHLHFDHVYGVAALARETGATVYACSGDEYLRESELGQGGFMGLPQVEPFGYDEWCEGEREVAGLVCMALPTPGHTKGSVTYHFPTVGSAGSAFVGDVVFKGAVGRTDFPGGDARTLTQSIKQQIFALPDDTELYSGHGLSTTVDIERRSNPMIR